MFKSFCFFAAASLLMLPATSAQTIGPGTYNLPDDGNIGDDNSIGSNTTINLFTNGAIGTGFEIGLDGSTVVSSVVNNVAGSLEDIRVFDGGEVNLSGGSTRTVAARSGGTVNVTGGDVSDSVSLTGAVGTVSGGTVRRVVVRDGSELQFSGGEVESLAELFGSGQASSMSRLSGGHFTDQFTLRTVEFSGGEFLVNGMAVSGPIATDEARTISGTLSDGSTFYLARYNGSFFRDVSFVETSLPDIDPAAIIVSSLRADLRSLRNGQSMTVVNGGEISGSLTSFGASIDVQGGTVFGDSEFIQSSVVMSGGEFDGGNLFTGVELADHSQMNMNDGVVSSITLATSSELVMSGGTINGLLTIGTDESDLFNQNNSVRMAGGSHFERLNLFANNELELVGTAFFLDGLEMDSLLLNDPTIVLQRNGEVLSGTYVDGSEFSYILSGVFGTNQDSPDFFSSDATLRITLVSAVPEPSTSLAILGMGALLVLKRRRNGLR